MKNPQKCHSYDIFIILLILRKTPSPSKFMKIFKKMSKIKNLPKTMSKMPNFKFWKNLKKVSIYIYTEILATENNMSFFHRKLQPSAWQNDMSFLVIFLNVFGQFSTQISDPLTQKLTRFKNGHLYTKFNGSKS